MKGVVVGKMRRKEGPGIITLADAAMVALVSRHGMATTKQIARFRKTSLDMARRRLAIAEGKKLIRKVTLPGRLVCWIATQRGCDYSGVSVGPPVLSGLWPQYLHALQLVDLLPTLARKFSLNYETEREVRARLWREARVGTSAVKRCPDGVLYGRGVNLAVELDRSPRTSAHLKRLAIIYLAEMGGGRYQGVIFVVESEVTATRYRRVFASVGAEKELRAVVWAPPQ